MAGDRPGLHLLQRRAPARRLPASLRQDAGEGLHRRHEPHRCAHPRGLRQVLPRAAHRGRLHRLDDLDRRQPLPRHPPRHRAQAPRRESACRRRRPARRRRGADLRHRLRLYGSPRHRSLLPAGHASAGVRQIDVDAGVPLPCRALRRRGARIISGSPARRSSPRPIATRSRSSPRRRATARSA